MTTKLSWFYCGSCGNFLLVSLLVSFLSMNASSSIFHIEEECEKGEEIMLTEVQMHKLAHGVWGIIANLIWLEQ